MKNPSKALAKGKWPAEVKSRLANAAKASKYLCVSLQKGGKDVHDMSVRFTKAKMVVFSPRPPGRSSAATRRTSSRRSRKASTT